MPTEQRKQGWFFEQLGEAKLADWPAISRAERKHAIRISRLHNQLLRFGWRIRCTDGLYIARHDKWGMVQCTSATDLADKCRDIMSRPVPSPLQAALF